MRGTNHVLSGPGISHWQSLRAHARWWLAYFALLGLVLQTILATFTSEKSAKEILEHIHGVAESWKYEHEKCYLCLLTGTPATSGVEGVTIKKIKEKECTVTGYARFQITNGAGKKVAFSESAGKGIIENSEEWTVQTGLSGANQAITYWATVTGAAGEEGKPIDWGSTTSTEIGGTGTPVKVASGKESMRRLLAGTFAALLIAVLTPSAIAQVYQWGNDGAGTASLTPSLLSALEPAEVSASNASAYFRVGNTVYAVGGNKDGQLGNGTTTESEAPVEVHLPADVEVCSIGEAEGEAVAVLCNGKVLGWGADTDDSLCGKTKDIETPVYLTALEGIVEAHGGEGHIAYRTASGTVLSCGSNGDGELGDGVFSSASAAPKEALGLSGVSEVSAGEKDTCALTTAGAVYCWGGNAEGQIGDGSTENVSVPRRVIAEGASEVSAGGNLAANGTTVALLAGEVLAWGDNALGQFGDGNTTSSLEPHPTGLHYAEAIAGGEASYFRVGELVYAAGSRKSGQLGDGSQKGFSDVPELVSGVSADEVSATARDALAGG
jgi:alpha-tubulin suppressor-like RCC1 family protein